MLSCAILYIQYLNCAEWLATKCHTNQKVHISSQFSPAPWKCPWNMPLPACEVVVTACENPEELISVILTSSGWIGALLLATSTRGAEQSSTKYKLQAQKIKTHIPDALIGVMFDTAFISFTLGP